MAAWRWGVRGRIFSPSLARALGLLFEIELQTALLYMKLHANHSLRTGPLMGLRKNQI